MAVSVEGVNHASCRVLPWCCPVSRWVKP